VQPTLPYEISQWALLIFFFLLLVLAGEIGYRFGTSSSAHKEATKSHVSVVEGSLVGVLALLLGFTMSMAVSRYETRKQLALEEANAIGTSYLRTQLLPDRERADIGDLLRKYVDLRIRYGASRSNLNEVSQVRRETHRLQAAIWTRAADYGRGDSNPVRSGLLLQSLNQVIDLEAAEWMALYNRVPWPVICLDGAVACLAAILVGYGFGLERGRNVFSMCVLALAVSIVLAVIIDLDSPRQGLIQIRRRPMIDLQTEMNDAPSRQPLPDGHGAASRER